VTQHRRQPADFLVSAVQEASHTALTLAVVIVALIGADASVAVSRTAGSPDHGPVAVAPSTPTGSPVPDTIVVPVSPPAQHSDPVQRKAESVAAKALLKAALANALAQGSVHAVTRYVSKAKHRRTAIFDNHNARRGGVQHLTIYGGHVDIRVVGSSTYYSGDRRGLVKFLLYKPKAAKALGDRWVRLQAGERGYQVLTEGVRLASLLHNERLVGPLRKLPQRVIDGTAAIGIQGRGIGDGVPPHSIATWWITTGPNPLPVEFDAANGKTGLVQTFSDWGKPIRLKPPRRIFE
jgi:hypothetical protein